MPKTGSAPSEKLDLQPVWPYSSPNSTGKNLLPRASKLNWTEGNKSSADREQISVQEDEKHEGREEENSHRLLLGEITHTPQLVKMHMKTKTDVHQCLSQPRACLI